MAKRGQNLAPRWAWTEVKHKAAQLLAEDELTDQEIADGLKIKRQTLYAWKKVPAFAQAVKDAAEELGDAARRYAVARKVRRIRGYDDRRARMLQVIEERARAAGNLGAPGGKTGLLVRTVKMIGSGPQAKEVTEFAVDVALLKELRELEKQVAVECGQWTEKREHSFDIDAAIHSELARLAGGGQAAPPGASPQDAGPAAGGGEAPR